MSSNKQFFCFICVAILVIFSIHEAYSYIDYKEDKKRVREILQDIETVKARKQLREIDSKTKELNKLIVYCIKQIKEPILITEMETCKDSSIKYLGYNRTYRGIKDLADRPLHKELRQAINKETYE